MHRYLIFAILIVASCSVDAPQMPTWDVTLRLPIATESYTVADLADDDRLVIEGDSLEISIRQSLGQYYLGDNLCLDAYSDSFSVTMGDFELPAVPAGGVSLKLRDLWDEAPEVRMLIAVDPLCFSDEWISREVDLGERFTWIEFARGTLKITVKNHLSIALGYPEGGCPLTVRLESGESFQDSFVIFEPIAPGDSATWVTDLSGRILENVVSVRLKAGTPGSDGEVYVDPNDSLVVRVAIDDARAQRAFAEIQAQDFTSSHTVVIGDSSRIVHGEISDGALDLRISNDLPTRVTLALETDNLSLEGEPLAIDGTLEPFETSTFTVDLAGYDLSTQALGGDPFEGSNEVGIMIEAHLDSSDSACEISAETGLRVGLELRSITFKTLTGTIKPTEVSLYENIDLDFPSELTHIDPARAILRLDLENTSMLGGTFRIDLEGERDGTLRWVELSGEIEPGPGRGASALTTCEFENPQLTQLVGLFPETMLIEGSVTLSGEGTLESSDFIAGDVEIVVPLVFKVEAGTLQTTPRNIEINDDIHDAIEEGVIGASFVGNLVTTFPFEGDWRMVLGTDSSALYDNPDLILPKDGSYISLRSAGEESQTDQIDICLDESDLEIFLLPDLWLGLEIRLKSTDGYVSLTSTDYVKFEGKIAIVRRVE